jgi:hypothetical protein
MPLSSYRVQYVTGPYSRPIAKTEQPTPITPSSKYQRARWLVYRSMWTPVRHQTWPQMRQRSGPTPALCFPSVPTRRYTSWLCRVMWTQFWISHTGSIRWPRRLSYLRVIARSTWFKHWMELIRVRVYWWLTTRRLSLLYRMECSLMGLLLLSMPV